MKGAIFDMDGTLLDSMPVWKDFGARYLRGRGVQPPADIWEILESLSMLEAARYMKRKYGFTEPAEQIVEQYNRQIYEQYSRHVRPKADAPDFLRRLREAGVKICVATATDRAPALAAFERLGMLDSFEFVLTCSEVGRGKDVPDIFEQALARLGTPKAETMVFEDALYAVRTAKGAGFPVTVIRDDSAAHHEAQLRALADQMIDAYAQVTL